MGLEHWQVPKTEPISENRKTRRLHFVLSLLCRRTRPTNNDQKRYRRARGARPRVAAGPFTHHHHLDCTIRKHRGVFPFRRVGKREV
jgi:hypothetical protein